MTIPKTVKVAGLTYAIVHGNKALHDYACTWGMHQPSTQTIQLAEDMQPDREAETFLHELMHAALSASGMNHLIGKEFISDEDVVTALSTQMYQIITDNKLIFT